MIVKPMDVLEQFPIRKTGPQKQAFRAAALCFAREHGYDATVETGKGGVSNIVIGDPERAKYLVTAHYDTPANIGIPNFCVPCNVLLSRLMYFVGMFLGAGLSAGAAVLFLEKRYLPAAVLVLAFLGLFLLLQLAPANRSNANDNTSGVVTMLEIMATLPENLRDRVCFVLFDLEEQGKKGSAAYRKAHKTVTETQIMLNLDCVGDGDHILLMPEKMARKDEGLISRLTKLENSYGKKQILVISEGYCNYNSDQKNFPMGVAIGAFHKKRRDYVLGKIHTKHDTALEYTNVNILRAAIISLIASR